MVAQVRVQVVDRKREYLLLTFLLLTYLGENTVSTTETLLNSHIKLLEYLEHPDDHCLPLECLDVLLDSRQMRRHSATGALLQGSQVLNSLEVPN